MKRIICITLFAVCLIGLLLFTVTIISSGKLNKYTTTVRAPKAEDVNYPYVQQEACFLFDPNNKEMMSGYSDYITVIYVEKKEGTIYQNVREDEGQIRGTPYTVYSAKVLENMKGNLTKTENIKLYQYGGVSIDEKEIVYITPLLDAGKCYVLYSGVANDQNLYVNLAYEMSELNNESDFDRVLSAPENGELLKQCMDAYRNEDLSYASDKKYVTPYDVDSIAVAE